jgi:hypothetical protein
MNVRSLFTSLVHLVIVEESKYEYGLTACHRDFVLHGDFHLHDGSERFLERDVDPMIRSSMPHTCLWCAVERKS